MKKVLVEGYFGHGGIRTLKSRLHTKVRRVLRPKLAMASIPFDWSTGIHSLDRIGSIPIKNQLQSSSCGGQAKAYWLGTVNAILTGQPYKEQSAKSIYSQIFYSGGGTTVYNLEKDLGSLDEIYLPSQPTTESNLEDKSWMTASNLKLAMDKAGWTAISVNIDMESMAEAIRDYGAFIWEITGQNNGTWLTNNPKQPVNRTDLWNHFMCSEGAGIWAGQRAIDMFQSWGSTVGDNGIQHFTDYINSGYIIDCFTFVKKNPKFVFSMDMKFGDKNNDVLQLQKRLGVWQTGYFGAVTLAAVIFYQKWHGLPETGYVGPLTRAMLNN